MASSSKGKPWFKCMVCGYLSHNPERCPKCDSINLTESAGPAAPPLSDPSHYVQII
jgi:hypothetical protein